MKLSALNKSKKLKIGISLALILALVISSFCLGSSLKIAEVENPVQGEDPLQITLLKTGDNVSEEITKGEEGDQSAGASKPDDTIVEQSDHKKQEETDNPKDEQEKQETESQTPEPDDSATDGNEESQDDGLFGEEGDEEADMDLAMVMIWYKYGKVPKTIVCGPSQEVSKTLNVAQLQNQQLKYEFYLTGEYAENVSITGVSMQEGDAENISVSDRGKMEIRLPNQSAQKDYTFYVDAQIKGKNADGETVKEDITFTFILHCHYAMDLELVLNWEKKGESNATMICAANDSVSRSIESNQVEGGILSYVPELTGALAKNANITKGYYTTASGKSGELHTASPRRPWSCIRQVEKSR